MNFRNFSDRQRQALLDLLVLGMYSDDNLTVAEDAVVQSLLDTFQFDSDYSRNRYLDASIARVRENAQTTDSERAYAVSLAQIFASPENQRAVCETLERLLASDDGVSAKESRLLSVVKEVFKM